MRLQGAAACGSIVFAACAAVAQPTPPAPVTCAEKPHFEFFARAATPRGGLASWHGSIRELEIARSPIFLGRAQTLALVPEEYPQAEPVDYRGLLAKLDGSRTVVCHASLITDRLLLTAAHCVREAPKPPVCYRDSNNTQREIALKCEVRAMGGPPGDCDPDMALCVLSEAMSPDIAKAAALDLGAVATSEKVRLITVRTSNRDECGDGLQPMNTLVALAGTVEIDECAGNAAHGARMKLEFEHADKIKTCKGDSGAAALRQGILGVNSQRDGDVGPQHIPLLRDERTRRWLCGQAPVLGAPLPAGLCAGL